MSSASNSVLILKSPHPESKIKHQITKNSSLDKLFKKSPTFITIDSILPLSARQSIMELYLFDFSTVKWLDSEGVR